MLGRHVSTWLLCVSCCACSDGAPAATGGASGHTASSAGTTPSGGPGPGGTSVVAVSSSAGAPSGATSGAGGSAPTGGALRFAKNEPNDHDYGHELVLPQAFGEGELTFEAWILLDMSFPVEPIDDSDRLTAWAEEDVAPYSSPDWWFEGNFLLDGHNNASFGAGTFSLQLYGGGRVRWLFGDGDTPSAGNLWAVQAHPASNAASLLDGAAHLVTCVRRFDGGAGAGLELWVDGVLVASERTTSRPNMRTYWDDFGEFPAGQEGWFWGSEKQAAIGALTAYEDFKGLILETRFWSRALGADEIAAGAMSSPTGDEQGLVGLVRFDEGAGELACDSLDPARCWTLHRMKPPVWIAD